MGKLKNRSGFTLLEMLIAVAITIILAGVAFVSVQNYRHSLDQIERDGIAQEIFVAAQNHLTSVYSEGYPGVTYFGIEEDAAKQIYYFIANGDLANNTIGERMLPFGSIDETVRAGGSILIRYQKSTGRVLDVFYFPENTLESQIASGDFDYLMNNLRGDEKKSSRQQYQKGSNVSIGWYGGAAEENNKTITLVAPTIKVVNAEKLYVEVTNPNTSEPNAMLKLIVTGVDSKAQRAFELKQIGSETRVIPQGVSNYTIILDDITTMAGVAGLHFCNIDADTSIKFNPGEDLEIQAVAYSTSALANIAYSAKYTTNSLFAEIANTTGSVHDKAYIGNIRHLENLDKQLSGLDSRDTANKLNITYAEQTGNFSWIEFQKKIYGSDSGYGSVRVYIYNSAAPTSGPYIPINPDYVLSYDGMNHRISDVVVTTAPNGGLFGSTSTVKEIKNLELLDFSIKATGSAGALAGTLSGTETKVTNVIARNTDVQNLNTQMITATSGSAGGLVGNMSGTVQYSAAIMVVNGSTSAGGLLGTSSATVTGCYSSGHTKDGSYDEWIDTPHDFDVTGATAGGLIGTITSGAISNSYTTCSVSGSTAGGFAGSASGGSITKSYSTGRVDVDVVNSSTKHAFIGEGSATLTGNYYYSIINEIEEADATWEHVFELLPPVSGGDPDEAALKAIDMDAKTYDDFVGAASSWNVAIAYDPMLVKYYQGKYNLKTIKQLTETAPSGYDWAQLFVSLHYGDWPAPELFTINVNTSTP